MSILIAKDVVREPLYCIVPLFNPWRHKSRWKHTERTIKHLMDSGAVVILVEIAFNRREFVFADSGLDGTPANCGVMGADHRFRHKYIGLRSSTELWLKECAIMRGVQECPYDWQQIAWIDGDVHFLRPNWVGECIHKLQHYAFLQMFSQARDLGPNYEMLPEAYPHAAGPSFMHNHIEQSFKVAGTLTQVTQADATALTITLATDPPPVQSYPSRVWPGLAWAARRAEFDAVGGLFDVAVWGGGDFDMAHALTEQVARRIHSGVHDQYRNLLLQWEDRCRRHVRRNVGVMSGTVTHYFHGRKTDRKYVEKRLLMNKVAFDPLRFLKRDYQGLYQLHDDGSEQFVHFRDMMRKISVERDEDSSDARLDLWNQENAGVAKD